MEYYLSIFFFFVLSLLNKENLRKDVVQLFTVIAFIFFLIFGGLRFEVGADWTNYEDLFLANESWSDVFSSNKEYLFQVFSYVFKLSFNNYSVFVFAFFFISFCLKFVFIKKYSPDIFLSLIIYIYTIFSIYDLNGIRQGMALGLCMLSISYILDQNIFKFIGIITIASLFHLSAIIFFPFYFLSRMKLTNKQILFSLLLVFIISIPFRSFLKNSQFIQTLFLSETFEHYSVYATSTDYALDVPIISFAVFQRFFIFILFIITYKKIIIKDEIKLLLRNGYFVGIILFLIFSFSLEISARLSFYYKAMEIIMIPLIVYSFIPKYQKMFLIIVFTLLSIVGMSRLLSIPDGSLIPYNNLLFL